MVDHSRDPCPYMILHEAGAGFVMGAVGGGIWHGIKGARNAPRGLRFEGVAHAIKARSPATAGNFAVWTGLLSAFDCAIANYRQKNDGWNRVLAGAGGPASAFSGAVVGGALMGTFEGFSLVFERYLAQHNRPIQPPIPQS
ncbi:unnamed protein product, partial [Rhizoctonia solani]